MVKLGNLSEEYFLDYLDEKAIYYAKEKVKAGSWPEKGSLERSRKEFERLLPNGLDTPNQYVKAIIDDSGNTIGVMWFGIFKEVEPEGAFIWDFTIEEKHRGKGYGKAALSALFEILKGMKVDKVSLHVFAHNEIAVNLYKKMDFETTDIMMSREIK